MIQIMHQEWAIVSKEQSCELISNLQARMNIQIEAKNAITCLWIECVVFAIVYISFIDECV